MVKVALMVVLLLSPTSGDCTVVRTNGDSFDVRYIMDPESQYPLDLVE